MRLIGHLESESSARTFSDYLYVQGIENQLEFMKGEGWGVWVNEEERIKSASKLLAGFRENPADPKYQAQAGSAEELRAERAKSEEAWRKRLRNRRHLFRPLTGYGFGPLTFVLIVMSVIVFLRSSFGNNVEGIQSLYITQWLVGDNLLTPDLSLPEIRHGEIWRLFTPMFIHFGPLHILFNMLWLRDLGSMIEGRQTSWHLAILALVIAAGSNLAQFYVSRSAVFGGMSGVVYGLLGYVWIRGKLDPGSGLFLHRSTVVMMMIWLVLCFTGLLGPIANYAHLAGLLMGMAWGYVSSLRGR
jgi:GlpG protein